MIIDHENKVLIATIPKCGTITIENLAAKAGCEIANRGGPGRGRHSLVPPEGCEGYARLMTTRNPWARLVSIWAYLGSPSRVKENAWESATISKLTFPQFVRFWGQHRQHWMPRIDWSVEAQRMGLPWRWLLIPTEFEEQWKPEALLRVEELADDLWSAGLDYGEPGQANTTKKHRAGEWFDYYTDDLYKEVAGMFAQHDALEHGYGITKVTGQRASLRVGE